MKSPNANESEIEDERARYAGNRIFVRMYGTAVVSRYRISKVLANGSIGERCSRRLLFFV